MDPPKARESQRVMQSPKREISTPKPKPMPIEDKPLLGYWDIRGLAQAIRYQLVYQGIEFVDQHLHHTEDVQSR